MATIVNNPAPTQATEGSGYGFLMGVILLIGFVMVLLYLGIPAVQKMSSGTIQVNIPTPQIVVPNKVDLNVTQTK